MRLERWQQIPSGTRDLLPDETARVREVVGGILGRVRRWGYREVTTPTLEYLDVFVRGEGSMAGDRLFKLVDRGGELLALRPEMTTSVARLVATRLRGAPLPLRLAYAGQVFRWREAGSARLREFPQVGCELIGAATLEADAEIVTIAVEALQATGVGQFSISLGHVGFLRGLLAGLDLPEPELEDVRALLYQKDFVGLRRLLETQRAAPSYVRALLALPTLQGPGALEEAGRLADAPEVRAVVEDLAALERMLRASGAWDAVTVDLSIIRDFDYYTGIVFEGHTTALGVPLLGGGRYDRLLERFGVPRPATGFAVRVERVLSAEEGAVDGWAPDAVVAFENGSREAALACARALRARDLTVAVEVQGRAWEEVAREAIARGVGRALLVRGQAVVVRERDGREHTVALADLVRPAGEERTS
jgi:ATP phosphoribosyltransferase regulatory subunit